MTRPRLLDLFCGGGGASVGYHRAGFDVVGVDIAPQPNYPFEFWQLDALEVLDWLLTGRWQCYRRGEFAAIHASPPCQAYSRLRRLPWLRDRTYPELIAPTRDLLAQTGLPWVIENVEDAPLQRQPGLYGTHGVVLCGRMFDLPIYRHRPFESNTILSAPPHRPHVRGQGGLGRRLNERRQQHTEILTIAGHSTGWTLDEQREAMGIAWMTRDELTQAIPPAYTEWVGGQLLASVSAPLLAEALEQLT